MTNAKSGHEIAIFLKKIRPVQVVMIEEFEALKEELKMVKEELNQKERDLELEDLKLSCDENEKAHSEIEVSTFD